jgi:hypothetical protein
LCIFDVFAAHRGDDLLEKLRQNNIHVVFVPASCTDRLQPLDLGINAPFKQSMKTFFEDFYASKVAEQLKHNTIKDVQIDMKLYTIKPLHAKWITKTFDDLAPKQELIKHAWEMAGII